MKISNALLLTLLMVVPACAMELSSDVSEKNVDAQDREGNTALMLAIKSPKIEYKESVLVLLGRGADVNIKNNSEETALILAAKKNLIEIMTLLTERGADLRSKDEKGNTFIDYMDPALQPLMRGLLAD